MSKKKVLFVTPSLCYGGREQSLITLLGLLDENSYDITLFLYEKDLSLLSSIPKWVKVVYDKDSPHYFRRPKAVIYMALKKLLIKVKATGYSEKIAHKLERYIHQQKIKHPSKDIFNKNRYDIVVSYAIGFCSEIAINIKANKHIAFFHNSVDLHHDLMKKQVHLYDKLVAVSEGVRKLLIDNYDGIENKLTVIQNFIDAKSIKEKASVGKNINYDGLKLCTCGRLSKEKGFDLALQSAVLLKEKGIDFIWYFVGDGEERAELESNINEKLLSGRIVITGFQDNPYSYMKSCDIYIQPSYQESFGLTIKEAIILGKEVVSTDTVGGNTVLEGGKYGQIVPVSVEGIVEGICNIYNNRVQNEKYNISHNTIEKNTYINQVNKLLNI